MQTATLLHSYTLAWCTLPQSGIRGKVALLLRTAPKIGKTVVVADVIDLVPFVLRSRIHTKFYSHANRNGRRRRNAVMQ